MDIKIKPSLLSGKLTVPPSKSISHRMLICAALSDGSSTISNLLECVDTSATIDALNALGANISGENGTYTVQGISSPCTSASVNCRESGSTLRFLIPIAAALGCKTEFSGEGKLPERPVTPLIEPLENNGVSFRKNVMPYLIEGRLKGGEFRIDGSVSSQFITGLLLALPLLDSDSEIILTSKLQSRPYVDITIDCMAQFGVFVTETETGFHIKGGQKYKAHNCQIEADMSQSAFWITANCIGSDIKLTNLNSHSVQGDKAIIEISDNFKCGSITEINAEHIPDLVPILAVLMSFSDKPSIITGCERLKIKECDRLTAITEELNKIGGKLTAHSDRIEIRPVKSFTGGECSSWNDHRIAMALSVAATRSNGTVIIRNVECINKSYPLFFDDYRELGGIADVI